ncbi:ATP-dependent RNA helicase DbpA [Thalassotalea piscium]|uniref:ATP-independent RNA helicase DbpA n=1 Tax=Thalassotalea piscium TaxID=1230533 RepID=A0A7X0NJW7_9GAMM|nr:ATP-dependent RNA helicase DbpA [Thalassotalea piscium]MBB6544837.1 ATP-independent RNA helicase DbpA [Thalassotalea piscium]
MSSTNFSSLPLKKALLENIESIGYQEMTPIQAQSLPAILQNKDIIAQGKTGSGKTVAFGLGLLNKLDVKRFCIQSLVLCPTRELADQVAKEIRKLARTIHNIKVLTLCGGLPMGPQIGSLLHGAHIIVGTPGRIEDHLKKNRLDLSNVNLLVLDEADRMLEMGFQPSLDTVLEHIPAQRQTLLFSATFPDQIQEIAKKITQDPVMAKVEAAHDQSIIAQHFYSVPFSQRIDAMHMFLQNQQPESCVIFCNMKKDTLEVTEQLTQLGFNALCLNGDLEQRDREQMLVCFTNKSANILVATDVAARGLDIEALDLVINYQLSHDPEVHVHRVGRTGRAGSKGMAVSFFDEKDGSKLVALEDYTKQTIIEETLPSATLNYDTPRKATMVTIRIDAGKKQKVRAGDILGALTGNDGINGKSVGKINLFDLYAYVAVEKSALKLALKKLTQGKIKGRNFRAWQVKL